MIDRDHRGRPYLMYAREDGKLWIMLSATSFDIAWPMGRPRALGVEIENLGLSGMIRLHRWQFSWGLTQSWNRYCYLADRRLERIHWFLGGGPRG